MAFTPARGIRGAGCILVVLAGCIGPAQVAPDEATPSTTEVLEVTQRASIDPDQAATEPAIAQLPDGTLVVAGRGTGFSPLPLPGTMVTHPSLLWRSRDGGASWQPLAGGDAPPGQVGRSDVDLAVDADGTLYVARMSFNFVCPDCLPAGPLPAGANTAVNTIQVGVSADGGDSLSWTLIAQGELVDRPWVRVAPDGAAHIVWNDGQGIYHSVSRDRGASWRQGPPVHHEGGDGGFDIGPSGELAVRVVPRQGNNIAPMARGTDGVAVSTDNGATWSLRTLPGNRSYGEEDPNPRFWDPVAFDAAGTLYAAWPEAGRLLLARSTDLGESWEPWVMADAGNATAFFPFLRGGAASVVGVGWYVLGGDEDGEWWVEAHIARVTWLAAGPVVAHATLNPDVGSGAAPELGEYFQVILLRDGAVGAVVPVSDGAAMRLQYFRAF